MVVYMIFAPSIEILLNFVVKLRTPWEICLNRLHLKLLATSRTPPKDVREALEEIFWMRFRSIFLFFRCSWCSSGNFCCYIFFLSNELLIMLLSWFNLCALEFAWTVVSWERESWCSKWWSFPEAFNKKNFLPQAMWFIFWTKKIFFCWFSKRF